MVDPSRTQREMMVVRFCCVRWRPRRGIMMVF
jgi:hypothetical protein